MKGTEDRTFIHDRDYYSHVFKKVENINSSIFFILDNIGQLEKVENPVIKDISETSKDLLSEVLDLMICDERDQSKGLKNVTKKVLYLGGLLKAAASARFIPRPYTDIILGELEIVERILPQYFSQEPFPLSREASASSLRAPVSLRKDHGVRGSAPRVLEGDRVQKIKEIIIEKGTVSIKDISDIVKDVSEKSIQRDLKSLIEKGEIIRQGDRRWSTYSIKDANIVP